MLTRLPARPDLDCEAGATVFSAADATSQPLNPTPSLPPHYIYTHPPSLLATPFPDPSHQDNQDFSNTQQYTVFKRFVM